MNAKEAAADIHDLQCDWERDGVGDEVVNEHRIELIIQQCIDDALEAIVVAIKREMSADFWGVYPVLKVIEMIREMKG